MTHLSLFTGVGGFDLGFDLAGFETVAQVEADAHCRIVLAHHWPEVPRYDDVREFDGRDWRGVDVLTGGFPCQDLSVAGKRAGLAGARSGLFAELCRVVGEARPRLLVWENVPGLLSADWGGAMATVLGSLADLGYSGGWRVLDSQFFGVPQRRRRVFGAFAPRGAGGWACGAAVLLEPEGGGWHPAAGGKAGEDVAGEPAACLNSGGNAGGFRTEPGEHLIANTLRAADGHHGHSSPRGDGADNIISVEDMGRKMSGDERVGVGACEGGPMYTLQSGARHGVAYALRQDPGGVGQGHNTNYVAEGGVRRLTPTEAEELQGFPLGWTDVDGMSDTQRYRQLGNAVTVNVAYWIALRARMVLQGA